MVDVDIYLNDLYQLENDRTGKCKLVDGSDLMIQNIKLEALTQEGDLFYDSSYGWSLLDFTQVEYDDILSLEIVQRVKSKLSKYEMINSDSIKVNLDFKNDLILIGARFKQVDSDFEYVLNISLDRINVEVIVNDR